MKIFVSKICILSLLVFFFPPFPASAVGWGSVTSAVTGDIQAVDLSGDTGYAVGADGLVLYSIDDGRTWSTGNSGTENDLFDVTAVSSTVAFAVGENGTIEKTTNRGEAWERLQSGSADLFDVSMGSSTLGYAAGSSGTIYKTIDGTTWTKLSSGVSETLHGIAIASGKSSTIFAVGENGTILKSIDSGTKWTAQSSGTSTHLYAQDAVSSTTVYVGGESATFLKTIDGGTIWTPLDSSFLDGETIRAMDFASSTKGWIAAGNEVWKTTDGGSKWEKFSLTRSSIVYDVRYEDDDEQWAAGSGGSLWRFDDDTPGKPTNFKVTSGSVGNDRTPTFGWSAAVDNQTSVASYEFRFDDDEFENIGAFTSYTPTGNISPGTHKAFLRAVDIAENVSGEVSVSFTITESKDPLIGKMVPHTALADTAVTFGAAVSDDEKLKSCSFFVDGVNKKGMSLSGERAYASYTFAEAGSFSVHVECLDEEGNVGVGGVVSVSVFEGSKDVKPGQLVKMSCPAEVYVNDPCTAVYYWSTDGMRHAFPNERVFNSWYQDFDDLVIVSPEVMATLPLGDNVTNRPGKRLVKFETSDAVYAISRGGVLRPIVSAEIASALYGEDWVADIDLVPDVFFGNYSIGELIESTNTYNASDEQRAVSKISDDV